MVSPDVVGAINGQLGRMASIGIQDGSIWILFFSNKS
jgi:hypothetical protein